MTAVRVYVADDHPIYRDGLIRALAERPEFEVVGQAHEGRTCLEDLNRLRPDVAILDLRMPGLDGIEIARALDREDVPTKVVLISAFTDGDLVFRALGAGAVAYLVKDATRDQICDAVAAAERGETVLSPAVQAQLVSGIRQHASEDQPTLSAREREILALIAEGLSAPDIGRRLHLSAATVKSHLQHVYEKLGVSDRAAAVAEGIRRRLLV
jgi:two-component system, NarL family, nitrate/nitrite response regulator NarL